MKIDNLIVRKGIFKEISSNLRFACASICQLEMGLKDSIKWGLSWMNFRGFQLIYLNKSSDTHFIVSFSFIAIIWLKYCQYGVKLYPINQSINQSIFIDVFSPTF